MHDQYVAFLNNLALVAGEIMRDHFEPGGVAFELKSDNTPVTLADKAIGVMVERKVVERFPSAVLIREEKDFPKRLPNGGLEFVIDELDGTNAFSRDIPVSVFAAVVMEDFIPLVSMVYASLGWGVGRRYRAIQSGGAYLNGTQISVSNRTVPRIAIATGAQPTEKYEAFRIATELAERGLPVETVYSMSRSCAMLAAGHLEGVLFPWGTLHDTVMGDLLVREAGGVASDLNGVALDYSKDTVDGFIMANCRETHDVLLEVVSRHRRAGQ